MAFEKCKNKLGTAARLAFPRNDATVFLCTDVSNTAIGAALGQQLQNGRVEPLGFFSKKLSGAQLLFSAYDRELLAIYEVIQLF